MPTSRDTKMNASGERDAVVTRAEVHDNLYGDDAAASSNVVDVYVGYLRKKLEKSGAPRVLHTRRGQGYILSAPEDS